MPAVYICYADDEKTFAEEFAGILRGLQLEVLTSDTQDLKASKADVDRSEVFFLVLSQGWRDSIILDTLVHYAFAQSKKIVILRRQPVDVPIMLRTTPLVDAIGQDARLVIGVLGEYVLDALPPDVVSSAIFPVSRGVPKEDEAPVPDWLSEEPVSAEPIFRPEPAPNEVIDDGLFGIEDDESTQGIEPAEPPRPAAEAPPMPSLPSAPPVQWQQSEPPPPVPQAPSSAPSIPSIFQGYPPRSSGYEQPRQAELSPEYFNPQFSAFYPAQVEEARPYALMVFAHIESAIQQVRDEANRYSPLMGSQPTSGTVSSTVEVATGTLLTLVPQITGLTFTPAQQVIQWDMLKPYYSATFLFQTPPHLAGSLSGRVLVFKDALIIGEIPINMAVGVAIDQKIEAVMQKLEPIFASYSHRDTPVMEYFRKTRAGLGQKMLVDIYDLRAGEHWADRLLEWIDDSAIFQLFWSKNSSQSKYCRQEWEYALKYMGHRDRFIQPVWWEKEMPAPPPELANLHFQKITLPPVTRLRLIASRVRGMFGGG